jgi:predicted Zn-dependent peptidase
MDESRIKLVLLNNIIGGPAMNSMLNLEIREKYGLGYHIESSANSYCDTGVWSIYLSTQKMHLEKSVGLVNKILENVKLKSISEPKLQKYKKQLLGQMAISLENPTNLVNVIAKSYLTFERLDTMSDLIKKVEQVSAKDLIDVANIVYHKDNFNSLIFESKY